jgi:excinuclease ABC subunit C
MKSLYEKLPDEPGVYLFRDARGKILYIGKAGNLKRRVSSYFVKAYDSRIEKLLSRIKKIDCRKTETALEALILEAELIKKFSPPFNVREKDDKSFLYIEITKERFPRVLLVRGREARIDAERTQINADNFRRKSASSQRKSAAKQYGPFTSASNIRQALRILRRIFPWSVHAERDTNIRMRANDTNNTNKKPCFDYELGLCPGTCIGAISREDYMKNIDNLKLLFAGKKKRILENLRKEMAAASKNLEFEKAEKLRRQIFALQHIRDTALISDSGLLPTTYHLPPTRVEGYDISNISGTSATGSMVVFRGSEPDKNEYRKFRIRTITQSDDVGMLTEVLRRRFSHWSPNSSLACSNGQPIAKGDLGWPLPALILIDGGKGQVNAAKKVLAEVGLKIPVVGIAKGPKRKRNDIIGEIPRGVSKSALIKVRNEAHRFALGYHKKLRGRNFIAP